MATIFQYSTNPCYLRMCLLSLLFASSTASAGTAIMANLDTIQGNAIQQPVKVAPQTVVQTPQAVQAPIQQLQPQTTGSVVRPQVKQAPAQMQMPTKPAISIQPRARNRPVITPVPIPAPKRFVSPIPIPAPKRFVSPIPIPAPKRFVTPIPIPAPKRFVTPAPIPAPQLPHRISPDLQTNQNFARATQQAAAEATRAHLQADISSRPQLLNLQKPRARRVEKRTPQLANNKAGQSPDSGNTGLNGLDHGQDAASLILNNGASGDGYGDGIYGDDNPSSPGSLSVPGTAFGDGKEAGKLLNNRNGGSEAGGMMFNLYGPVRPDIGVGTINKGRRGSKGGALDKLVAGSKGAAKKFWKMVRKANDVGAVGKGKYVHGRKDKRGVWWVTVGNKLYGVFPNGTVVGGQTLDGSGGDVDDAHGSPIPMAIRRKLAAARMPDWSPASGDGGANPIDPIDQSASSVTSSAGVHGKKSQQQQQQQQAKKHYAGKTPGADLIGPADPNLPGSKAAGSVLAPKGLLVVDPIASRTAAHLNTTRNESALDTELGLLSGPASTTQVKKTTTSKE